MMRNVVIVSLFLILDGLGFWAMLRWETARERRFLARWQERETQATTLENTPLPASLYGAEDEEPGRPAYVIPLTCQ